MPGVERDGADPKGDVMKARKGERGKVGWVVLWLLGIPIPVLLFLYFVRGCT